MSKDKKKTLTKEALLFPHQDQAWSYVPLGVTLNAKGKEEIVGWYLNDQNLMEKGYYGTFPSTSLLIAGGTGSGRDVVERCIVNHISKFSNKFQLVGADLSRVSFGDVRHRFVDVLTDVVAVASTLEALQRLMMTRFKMMEANRVNNIYKVSNSNCDRGVLVDYYDTPIGRLQFDTLLPVKYDIDENDRKYAYYHTLYPDGKRETVMTIEELVDGMKNGKFKGVTVNGVPFKDKEIKKVDGIFQPKTIIFMVDEMSLLMEDDDYKSVDAIKTALGSLARLGRASGIHLVLGCIRPSGSTISTDLKNNIQMGILMGGFDDGASTLMFEKDISNLCRPEIKCRGFVGIGNEIIETQMFAGAMQYF